MNGLPKPMLKDILAKRLAKSREERDPKGFGEIKRICSLPVVPRLTDKEVEVVCRREVLADKFEEGWRLWEPQANAILSYDQFGGLFLPIGVGWGKCVLGDTEVYDVSAGRRVRVDELPYCFSVPAIDEKTGRLGAHEASAFQSGFKDCVRVALRGGQTVDVSLDHPVFTDRGWVRAEALGTQHFVGTPRFMQARRGALGISDDEVALVAYLMADGGTTAGIYFTNETPVVVEELRGIVGRIGVPSKRWKHVGLKKTADAGAAETFSIAGVSHIVQKRGINCRSKEKRLPPEFYGLSERHVALYLNRFWACDGYVGEDKLEVCLASQGLIDDLRFLLLRLGITTRKHFKTAVCAGKSFSAWRLVVSGRSNVLRFLESVGFVVGKEAQCAALRRRTEVLVENPNVDIVPISRRAVQEICEELGHPGRGGARTPGRPRTDLREELGATEGQFIGRAKFQRWVEKSGYSGKYAWLAHTDLLWDRVESVKEIGQFAVYDLSVPSAGNFVGNGIVLHNTLIAIMTAERAYRKGVERILLLVPAAAYGEFFNYHLPAARGRVPLTVPWLGLGRKSAADRWSLASSPKRGVFVWPYSMVSQPDAVDVLEAIAPGLVIADEAHLLANRRAARTKRIFNYIEKQESSGRVIEGVAMSGTITKKSLKDYHHLIKWCCKQGCPLPLLTQMADEWSMVLDSDAAPSRAQAGPLKPLVDWGRENYPAEKWGDEVASFRKAYRYRLTTAPGVVSTGDQELGTSLFLVNTPVVEPEKAEGWKALEDHRLRIEREWLTPNGDEIEYSVHTFKWLYELSSGFYNQLTWPTPEDLHDRGSVTIAHAGELLEKAKKAHAKKQTYNRELRDFLDSAPRPGLDTPMLVAHSMTEHGGAHVTPEVYGAWRAWKEIFSDTFPERDSTAVRVCPFKINHAVEWARQLPKGKGGIVWVYHQEVGLWAYQALTEAGLPAIHCPSGRESDQVLSPQNLEKIRGHVVVASISAHGVGKNLQAFSEQMFLQWPRSAVQAEQALGRTHRNGQEADELFVFTCNTTEFDDLNFAACLNDSLYIHQSTGSRQKLIYAAYEPTPRVFPPEVLHERGFQNRKLTPEQRKLLGERFGQAV